MAMLLTCSAWAARTVVIEVKMRVVEKRILRFEYVVLLE